MGGKIIKRVPEPCKCDGKPSPMADGLGLGIQWQCDCGLVWELVMSRDQRGARYWSIHTTPTYTGADR